MSRRYGRNQRRKAREELLARGREIARLGAVASERYNGMISAMGRVDTLEAELIEWAGRILSLVGPESAFNRGLHKRGVDQETFDRVVERRGPFQVSPYPGVGTYQEPSRREAVDKSFTVLNLFATFAERDMPEGCYRFTIVAPDGRSALLMDPRTLHELRGRGDSQLVNHLLLQLLDPWVKGKKAR